MSKAFLVYGHYKDKSFNAAIRDTFISNAVGKGHTVDCVDLYKEKFNHVNLNILRNTESQGYGGNQKIGLHYAILLLYFSHHLPYF